MSASQRIAERINKIVFEVALRNGLRDETINVLHVISDTNFAKGTNYLSSFFKVHIVYSSRSDEKTSKRAIDIVVKSEPLNEMSLKMVREQDLFTSEFTMLNKILPIIEELVGCQIGPKLWYGSQDLKILVMEDLCRRGFVMKNRQEGLSIDHCLLVVRHLAKLHAGSVALYEKNPNMIEFFKSGGILSATCLPSYIRLSETSLENVSKAIQCWSDRNYSQVSSKLNKLVRTFRERCAEIYKYELDEFCVLNHGDCWINNIMFREDDNGKPCDVVMVDYQMTVFSSPAIDLHYFLNICPQIESDYEYDKFLLNEYLQTLTDTMASIDCTTKAPTMESLIAAMHRKRIYAVFAGIILRLRMMCNEEDVEDFTEVMDKLQGETKLNVFKNPSTVILAQKMIPIMDQRGYFD